MPELVWLTPFIHVPAPEDGAELRYSQDAADQVLRFFGLLVFGQNDWAGKPFQLLPWEEQLIREFYGVQVRDDDGTWVRYRRYLYNEIPKKNGKSELAAGLGLYHLWRMGSSCRTLEFSRWIRRTPILSINAPSTWWSTPP